MTMLSDLRWLISNSSLKNLKCIACPDMMDQTFDSVTIIDNIKMLKWIRQHELVLTNGYLFLNQNKEEIYKTIETLKKEGCAGLGIKIKSVFTDLPRDIVEAAVQYQLSIIEIPYFYTLSQVSEVVYNHFYEEIFQHRYREQRLIEDISDIFFSKRGVMEILYRIGEYLGRTVILLDDNSRCLYADKIMRDKDLCIKGDFLYRESYDNNHTIFAFPNKKVKPIYHINMPGENKALLVLEDNKVLCTEEISLLKRCIKILNMALQQIRINQAGITTEYTNYSRLYSYLCGSNDYSETELKELAYECKIPLKAKKILLLFQMDTGGRTIDYQKLVDLVLINWEKLPRLNGIKKTIFNHGLEMLIFLYFDESFSNPLSYNITEEVANEIYDSVDQWNFQIELKIGISRCLCNITSLRKMYHEAKRAIDIGGRVENQKKIYAFDMLVYYDYMLTFASKTKETLCENIMFLRQYDIDNNTELVKTLIVYFGNLFNITKTADELYIHRNTALKRLDKIKKLLFNDLETIDQISPILIEIGAYKLMYDMDTVY
jgi:PucR family transcriptional regulator, purine catabolism regulatory protein